MTELFEILKWPLLAVLVLPWLLVYLGLHIVQRQIIFVDLALAQVAALGTCLSILLGFDVHDWQSYGFSFGFTLVGAMIFTITHTQKHRVPQEALIGIVYVVAAAAGILILSQSTGGKEELQRSLIGELLVVTPGEIAKTLGLFIAIGAIHYAFRRQFLAITFAPEQAEAEGVSVRWWDFLFYILFGLVVTSFVHIGGVLLVFTYLIVPAVCATYLAKALPLRLLIGWVVATLSSVIGLIVTAKADWPIGSTIVCALGLVLLVIAVAANLRASRPVSPNHKAEGSHP
jgi:zinc/manganese transport system permease protein